MRAACAEVGRAIETKHDHNAVTHNPFVYRTPRELAQVFGALFFLLSQERIAEPHASQAHGDTMSLSGAHQSGGFEALGRARARARLSGKYQIDAIACRHRHSEIHSDESSGRATIPAEVSLDDALRPYPLGGFRLLGCGGGTFRLRCGPLVSCRFRRADCLYVFIFAFLDLVDL